MLTNNRFFCLFVIKKVAGRQFARTELRLLVCQGAGQVRKAFSTIKKNCFTHTVEVERMSQHGERKSPLNPLINCLFFRFLANGATEAGAANKKLH